MIERTRKTESNERIQNEKSGKVVKCERININRKKRIEKSNAFADNTNYARSTAHNKIVTEITFMFIFLCMNRIMGKKRINTTIVTESSKYSISKELISNALLQVESVEQIIR